MKYLTPILPSEASTRQEMASLVRRRMLEAFKECPSNLDQDISTGYYIQHLLFISAILIFDYLSFYGIFSFLLKFMTWKEILISGGLWSGGITLGLYAYYTYLIYMWPFASHSSSSSSSSSSSNGTSKSKSSKFYYFFYFILLTHLLFCRLMVLINIIFSPSTACC